MSETLLLVLGVAMLTAVLTRWSIGYALRHSLLDRPGQRRSHSQVTARGGGIAMVIAVLLAWAYRWPAPVLQKSLLLGGLALVAAVGWWDDHRSQPALRRLLIQLLAAVAIGWALAGSSTAHWLFASVLLLSAINICNFIDGINGLAASQSALLGAAVGGLAALQGQWPLAAAGWLLAAAALGFLPFNFPRARVFMGDVGSGFLGAAAASVLLLAWQSGLRPLPALLLLPSVLLIDAGMTLLSRMFSGRRWYTAHREHLYQWLVRSGMSHTRVTLGYAAASAAAMLLAVPLLDESAAWGVLVAVYGGLAAFWCLAKRRLHQQHRARARACA